MAATRQPLSASGPVNRAALIGEVARRADLTAAKASRAVDAMLDTVTAALCDGREVRLTGFGSFAVAERKASTGRNPRTGAAIDIPVSVSVRFKPGKILKDAVGEGKGG